MSDRELLELAAKAAGLSLSRCDDAVWCDEREDFFGWNPLTDGGDALRLAVKLGDRDGQVTFLIDTKHDGDPYAATRRAIVRAAAEIGRRIAQQTARADLPEDNYYKTMAEAEEAGHTAAEIGRSMK